MLMEILLAVLLPPLLLVGWVAVQNAWGRHLPTAGDDGDVLAGRNDCGACGCDCGFNESTSTRNS